MLAVNPDMLVLAREAEGYTLRELADKLSIGYSTLSRYESALLSVPDAHLRQIAHVLERPPSYFYRKERLYNASCMYHRKKSRITVRELKRIHAQVNELRIQAVALLRGTEIESDNQFHRLKLADYGTPEAVAQEVRRVWQLPTGPIRTVVGAIEDAGGITFRCEFRNRNVDGISQWPLDDDGISPIFCVNEEMPGDRQRFTLSHEIGHVFLHHHPTDDPEAEANRFASEFLMPAVEIGPELSRLSLSKAAELKGYWKVSMAAIVMRAHQLGKLTERQFRYLNMQLNSLGYRKCEPIPIPAEEPELFRAVLDAYRQGHRRTDSEMSDLLGLFEHEFRADHGYGLQGLRLVV